MNPMDFSVTIRGRREAHIRGLFLLSGSQRRTNAGLESHEPEGGRTIDLQANDFFDLSSLNRSSPRETGLCYEPEVVLLETLTEAGFTWAKVLLSVPRETSLCYEPDLVLLST